MTEGMRPVITSLVGSTCVIVLRSAGRVTDDRAGHAVAAATATAELGAHDGDDLDALLAQQRVGVGVAVIGEHHPGGRTDEVGPAVPLRAFAYVGVAAC